MRGVITADAVNCAIQNSSPERPSVGAIPKRWIHLRKCSESFVIFNGEEEVMGGHFAGNGQPIALRASHEIQFFFRRKMSDMEMCSIFLCETDGIRCRSNCCFHGANYRVNRNVCRGGSRTAPTIHLQIFLNNFFILTMADERQSPLCADLKDFFLHSSFHFLIPCGVSKVQLHAANIFAFHLLHFLEMFSFRYSKEEANVTVFHALASLAFILKSVDRAGWRRRVWHFADCRYSPTPRRERTTRHILRLRISWFTKMHVAVDETREDEEVCGIDCLCTPRFTGLLVCWFDGCDKASFNENIHALKSFLGDELAVLDEKRSGRHQALS